MIVFFYLEEKFKTTAAGLPRGAVPHRAREQGGGQRRGAAHCWVRPCLVTYIYIMYTLLYLLFTHYLGKKSILKCAYFKSVTLGEE